MSGAAVVLRVTREMSALAADPSLAGCAVSVGGSPLCEASPLHYLVRLRGPAGTPYEDGWFPAILRCPPDFPYRPPSVQFLAPIPPHPNVYADGKVCISSLQVPPPGASVAERACAWRPSVGVVGALLGVVSLLADPNPGDPASQVHASMMRDRPEEFARLIRRCVEQSKAALPMDFKHPDDIMRLLDEKKRAQCAALRLAGAGESSDEEEYVYSSGSENDDDNGESGSEEAVGTHVSSSPRPKKRRKPTATTKKV